MANEVLLIDANDLWADIMMLPHNGDMISSEEVERAIKDAPTVDAVPVVRCANCIHRVYMDLGDEAGMIGGCGLFGTAMMTCNDFCSYGQKMDGDGNA